MRLAFPFALAAIIATAGCATAAEPPAATAACEAAKAYSAGIYGVSLLVLKNGGVVCEGYANTGAPAHDFPIHSGTKSFTGVIAAAAVQDGLLTLDEPVSRTITEWRSDPRKATVTIRQLLQLTSGMSGKAFPSPDFAEAVAMPLTAEPGTTFQYAAAPFQVFGELMRRKLVAAGRDPDPLVYLKTRVLDPISVSWTSWRRTPAGDPMMDQGANFTPGQWARFGEFIRAGGVVDGKPILDPTTFGDLFKGSTANPAYGISWWLPKATSAADPVTARLDLRGHEAELPGDMVIAAGAGDQRLFVVPSCGLTVVRQAKLDARRMRAARAGGRAGEAGWSDYAFITTILDGYCR